MAAKNRVLRFMVVPSLALVMVTSGGAPLRSRVQFQASRVASAESECRLGAQEDIRRVVFIQFDNVHFRRDVPNVPSDLEQMPHLLGFITDNGTLLTDDHTVLISHTATGFLSAITGFYPDRMGQPISNSYRYFTSTGASRLAVSFAYWTAPVYDPNPGQTDFTPTMIDERGKVAPAPWVAYTRSHCDVGIVGMANTVLENVGIDIPTVFGPNSPEAAAVQANSKQAFADYVGIGVHCAQDSVLCAASAHARPDLLPYEPGGYDGYTALFGHKYVAPVISPSHPLPDINGTMIADSAGRVGFPGWDSLTAAVALGYTATMLEAGIPVTYTYLSATHDQNPPPAQSPFHLAFGPGEAGYVAQLRAYDDAFGKFFARLAARGITAQNTLFVFSADEGDHFVGGPASPSGCDGVTTPCTYPVLGEVNLNLRGLLATQRGNTTPFQVHSDSAPTVYIDGNPGPSDPVTRRFEQDASRLTVTHPITGVVESVTAALAGPAEMKLLHMVTSDPLRTPTFTLFGGPDYFFFRGGADCASPCVAVQRAYAWNHGTIDPAIMQTWVGFVGPGVRHAGPTDEAWADHADIRPTMLALLGLQDQYISDGRVLAEIISPGRLPDSLRTRRETFIRLATLYKKINAPIGDLARASLVVSTRALATTDEPTYARLTQQIQDWTAERNRLAARMKAALYAAAFGSDPVSEGEAHALIAAGESLLDRVQTAAGSEP